MKKKIILLFGIIIVIMIGYFIYATIITIGSQRLPTVEKSQEIKNLEKIILKETKSGIGTYFTEIPKHKIKTCNATLQLNLVIYNDSISVSQDSVKNYIQTIVNRVNATLTNKNCIDSLIIEGKSYYSKANIDSLKLRNFRYSFPIQ